MHRLYCILWVLLLMYPLQLFSQTFEQQLDSLRQQVFRLTQQLDSLKKLQQQQALEQLRQQALQSESPAPPIRLKRKTFRQGALNLQKLNPEISITGDALSLYSPHQPLNEPGKGLHLRVVGLHLQSSLDPFSFSKITIAFNPAEGVAVEEAYMTWTNPLPRTSLTVGRFRQQLGIINRWHVHALDQSFFPLVIRSFLGEEGLAQTGLSLHSLLPPLTASANEITLQITHNENSTLWGNGKGLPNLLVHFKNYYDLTLNTYLEIGFTGLIGTQDSLGFQLNQKRGITRVAGVDITLSWSPAQLRLYRQLDWRSEVYWISHQPIHRPHYSGWGGFTYLQYRLNRSWYAGLRLDFQEPLDAIAPYERTVQAVPYVTFWQSEFVYLRFQYTFQYLPDIDQRNQQWVLQLDWAFGPHKHEKY